jgi:hypothetical protein
VKKIVKENYYNLSPLPSAEPVKSNGNGVDGVIPKKKIKKESRVDDAQPFGRAGGVQSQQAAKALAGTPSAESERLAAAKKRAAMKKAAGMQELEEQTEQTSLTSLGLPPRPDASEGGDVFVNYMELLRILRTKLERKLSNVRFSNPKGPEAQEIIDALKAVQKEINEAGQAYVKWVNRDYKPSYPEPKPFDPYKARAGESD